MERSDAGKHGRKWLLSRFACHRSVGPAASLVRLASPRSPPTRLTSEPTVFSVMRESASASPRAASGSTARAKPSFAASLSRAALCGTGRTAPESETSPK